MWNKKLFSFHLNPFCQGICTLALLSRVFLGVPFVKGLVLLSRVLPFCQGSCPFVKSLGLLARSCPFVKDQPFGKGLAQVCLFVKDQAMCCLCLLGRFLYWNKSFPIVSGGGYDICPSACKTALCFWPPCSMTCQAWKLCPQNLHPSNSNSTWGLSLWNWGWGGGGCENL